MGKYTTTTMYVRTYTYRKYSNSHPLVASLGGHGPEVGQKEGELIGGFTVFVRT